MCEKIEVSKKDLLQVWSLLENLRVSLHRIGAAYAYDPQNTFPSNQLDHEAQKLHQQELEALEAYFTPELYWEIAEAWRILSEYLSDEETEALSEGKIQYWELRQ